MLKQHIQIMQELKDKHENILNLIADRDVVYLDIPVYDNIGDLLIMHGTLKLFKENNIDVTSMLSCTNFYDNSIEKESVIVFQGGGNLGDLYTNHQHFREKVIGKFKNNTIIILAQSIYFRSNSNYEKCCNIFKDHSDLHIFTRDVTSYDLAKEMSENVYLASDLAHQLYPISAEKCSSQNESIFIKRDDAESILDIHDQDSTDWNKVVKKHKPKTRMIKKLFKLSSFLHLNQFTSNYLAQIWINHSYTLVDEAILLFSQCKKIKTDRLHAHILACLMDKRNEVYDNSYKKIFNYIDSWTLNSILVQKRIQT